MNNQEKLKEMISILADCHINSLDAISAYLASIALSLAVIADNLTTESEEKNAESD